MRIVTHFAVTVNGFAADREGTPAILAAPDFDHGKAKLGFPEFRANLEAVAIGRTTFDPAPRNAWWPWPELDVHVLTSHPLPSGSSPARWWRIPIPPRWSKRYADAIPRTCT